MKISDKAYDILKFVTQILPIVSTLYAALSELWALPLTTPIIGTIAAINTALIALMKHLEVNYEKENKSDE